MTTKTAASTKNESLINLRPALRKGGRAYCHAEALPGRESYSDAAEFNFSVEKGKLMTTGYKLPGIIRNGHDDVVRMVKPSDDGSEYPVYDGVYRPLQGFFQCSYSDTLSSALESLPDDAAVSIEVYLDAGTNELCVERRLHVDHIYLHAKWYRGKKEHKRTFLLQSSTGLHNSARFGSAR